MKRKYMMLSISMISILSTNMIVMAAPSDTIQSNNKKIDALQNQKQDLEEQKRGVDEEIVELVKQMESKQGEIDIVQEKIDALQKEIDELQSSINKTSDEIEDIEKTIKKTEDEYTKREKEQTYQEEILSNRLKRNYMNDTYNEFLGILLDSSSVSEVLFKAKYVRDIVNSDKDIIESLKDTKLKLAIAKEELDKDKRDLDSKKSSLEYQKESMKDKQDIVVGEKTILDGEMEKLNDLEKEKQSRISSIMKSKNYVESQIQDLTNENTSLSDILNQSSSNPSGVGDAVGRLIKPTTGRYTSRYGMRIHPITGKQSFHKGLDIANSYGTKVVAADGGKVIKAGYNGAYGNSIVIDHGNGYSTLYAHFESMNVSVGDIVKQGQKIGGMGSTGWSTGPHLHYEVWKNGKHLDPMNFM